MTYLIQCDDKGLPHHFDCACAMYGAIETAQNFRLTSFDEIKSGKLCELLKRNVAVGSVEFMHEVFSQLNIEIPCLPRNSNRQSKIISLQSAIEIAKSSKIFIKPQQQHKKLFTGFVLDGSTYTCLKDLPNDLEIITYEPFSNDIISEWRTYVFRDQIFDTKNYSGDPFKIPSFEYVKNILKENKLLNFPSTYTIDVGILSTGENVVIEFNDMYAIGNYGVRNDYYISFLRERYFQILK